MQEGILYDLSFFDSLRGVLLRILNYKQKSLSLKLRIDTLNRKLLENQ
jgi:hypothetical protein